MDTFVSFLMHKKSNVDIAEDLCTRVLMASGPNNASALRALQVRLKASDVKPEHIDRALRLACRSRDFPINVVDALCVSGGQITDASRPQSLLALAAENEHVELCQWLLARAPELLHQADCDGNAPLHIAARSKQSELVQVSATCSVAKVGSIGNGSCARKNASWCR